MSVIKTFDYLVRCGNDSLDKCETCWLLIGYTRSRAKSYAKTLRLRYKTVCFAKIDYTL